MEVRVDTLGEIVSSSQAKDTFVAVRFGDVQKQSRLAAQRTYRFSDNQVAEDVCHGRIEVFRRIGTASVELKRGAEGAQEVEIACSDPEFASLRLAMTATGKTCAQGAGKSRTKKMDKLDDAKRYVDDHNLEELVASAMREVIHNRPVDPHKSLSQLILQIGEKLKGDASKPVPVSGQQQLEQTFKHANSSPPMLPTQSVKLAEAQVEDIRQRTQAALISASQDGTLTAALGQTPEAKGVNDELCRQARDALVNGSRDGSLSRALKASGSGSPVETDALKQAEKDTSIEAVRLQAREALLSATEGSIAQALSKPNLDPQIVEESRKQAFEALQHGYNDGTLAAELQAAATGQGAMEQLRLQARDAFLKSGEDGSLAKVLSVVMEAEAMRPKEAAASTAWNKLPSVGTWAQRRIVKLQPAIAQSHALSGATTASALAPSTALAASLGPWRVRPSVGTWSNLKSFRQTRGGQEAIAIAASPSAELVQGVRVDFRMQPSVGTWLAPARKPLSGAAAPLEDAVQVKVPFARLPSAATWLAQKPPQVKRPWYYEAPQHVDSEQSTLIHRLQDEISKRDHELEELRRQVELMAARKGQALS